MLDIIGLVLMLLVIAYIIAVVFIVMEINDLKRKLDGFYVPYNDLDDVFRDISDMEINVYDLQEKVEKLEKEK